MPLFLSFNLQEQLFLEYVEYVEGGLGRNVSLAQNDI